MKLRRVLTDTEWQAVQNIRQRVFIQEQACPPEEEWDVWDEPEARGQTCHHLLGIVDDIPVAVARWRPVDHAGHPAAKLERFAVLAEWRGQGFGRAMVEATLREAQTAGFTVFILHAQTYLEALYVSLGFQPVGNVFEEAGIPHIAMVHEGASPKSEA